jgi:PAS domain S-box-containing protein
VAAEKPPPEKVVLALKWFHQFQFAGYYAAQAQGYYAAEGLDVEIREPQNGHLPLGAVVNGEANFGVAAADLLLARARGAPVVALAVIFQHSPVVAVSRADRHLRRPPDLIGKTVMIEDQTAVEFKAMLLRENIPLNSVRFVPHTWRLDELIGGQVDATVDYVTDQPNRMRLRGVDPAIMRPIDYGIDFYGDCLFTSEQEIHDHPARVAAFRRASLMGWEYALTHVEEMIALILALPGVKERGVTADHLRYEAEQMATLIQATLIEIGHMNPGRWRQTANTYAQLNLLPREFPLDEFLYAPKNGGNAIRWLLYLLAGALVGVVGVGSVAALWNRQLRRSVKNTTRELRQSQEYLKSVLDSSNDAIFVHDARTGQLIDVNQRTCEMYGCTREQALQSQANDFGLGEPPFSQTEAKAWLQKARTEGPQTFVWLARRFTGASFWTEVSARYSAIGGEPRFVVLVRDITDRKQAEAELTESTERFRILIDTVPDLAIHGYRMDGTATYWNATCTRLYGYTAEEAIGKNLLDLIVPPELHNAVRANIKAMKLGATSFPPGELVLRRKDGSRVHVYSGYAVIRLANRPPQFFCMDIDLTARLQAEKALRESESRFHLMFERHDAIMMLIEPQTGAILDANEAATRFYGYPKSKLCSMAINEINVLPADQVAAELQRALNEQRKFFVFPHKLANGNVHTMEVHSSPILFQDRPVLFSILHDITERRRAEEERRKLQDQLAQAQKMESIGRLAGGVAHDFNNMLGVIMGYTEMAMEQVDPALPVHGDLTEILKAARRSADLTRQLLAYARKQTVAPKVLDLNETIAGSLNMLRRLIGENLELVWQPGSALWAVKIDPMQIDQILTNLCVNARDAIRGVGRISIQTGNVAVGAAGLVGQVELVPGDYVELKIADTGCGMDEDMLGHLFEPFFTTKGMGRGTGLGLAMVYGIVKQNAGVIEVKSKPGRGAVFTIYLPRHAGPLDQPPETQPVQIQPARGQTILLVEDEPALLSLCRSILERLGYPILAAANPIAGIQLAQAHVGEIHLLITDVVMPEMNGQDLALRLAVRHPNLKRLFISGYTADIMAQQGVLEEGIQFLQKPFTQADLIAKVQAVLEAE